MASLVPLEQPRDGWKAGGRQHAVWTSTPNHGRSRSFSARKDSSYYAALEVASRASASP